MREWLWVWAMEPSLLRTVMFFVDDPQAATT